MLWHEEGIRSRGPAGAKSRQWSRVGAKSAPLTSRHFYVENPTIDFVICSHTDQDHASGLGLLFESFHINVLFVNRPWLYIDDIFDKVTDGRITKASLEARLKEAYPYVNTLEEKANEAGTPIYEGFQGITIYRRLKVLSPAKEFYTKLLIESNKTPLTESATAQYGFFTRVLNAIKTTVESWTNEFLKEDVTTTPENEAAIIIYGDMGDERFLLTGDSGVRALKQSIDYANSININIQEVKIHQIPHHGGRHNVSPSILDSLLGEQVKKDARPTKTAFVSVGKGTDHPKKMVTNAYMRRGAKVFEARNATICHQKGTPDRTSWTSVNPMPFSEEVEDWE